MGFNLDRRMYEVLGSTPTVPGAIGAFRREALADIGGISGATLAEDTDITLDIGRTSWRVLYENRARAWTEAPSTLRGLFAQRQPLGLWHDSVDVEAPPRAHLRRRRQHRGGEGAP